MLLASEATVFPAWHITTYCFLDCAQPCFRVQSKNNSNHYATDNTGIICFHRISWSKKCIWFLSIWLVRYLWLRTRWHEVRGLDLHDPYWWSRIGGDLDKAVLGRGGAPRAPSYGAGGLLACLGQGVFLSLSVTTVVKHQHRNRFLSISCWGRHKAKPRVILF